MNLHSLKLSAAILLGTTTGLCLFSEKNSQSQGVKWTESKWVEFKGTEKSVSEAFFWALENEGLFEDSPPVAIAPEKERRKFEYYKFFLSAEEPEYEHERPFPDYIGSSSERFYILCQKFVDALQSGSALDLEFTFESRIFGRKTGGFVVHSIRPDGSGTIYIMVADYKNGRWTHRNHTWTLTWD